MQKNNNILIKEYARKKGVYQYEIADVLGISEFTFLRRLRKELPKEEVKRLKTIIDEISKKAGR